MNVQPLTGKALEALAHPSPSIEAYEGSVRSSKTVTTLIDWLRFIRTGPAGNLAMCGRTERTVINNMVLPLQEMLGAERVRVNYGQGTVNILGRDIMLFGANNEQSRTKIQGLTLAGALVDEASTVPESFFNMLYSRLSVPGAKLWLTANPEGPAHWLKIKWLDRACLWITRTGRIITRTGPDVLDLHRYTFTLDDNPSLDPAYVERLKRSYTGMWRRRYIDAEWVAADGAVFDMWNPDTMVVPWDQLPRMERLVCVGMDYGTQNPTSAEILGIGEDGILYFVDEWRLDSTNRGAQTWTDAQQSQKFLPWLKNEEHAPGIDMVPQWIILDPAAASFKVQLRQDGAWGLMDAENDVLYGIRLMATLLASGVLKVSSKCRGLIDEIPGYSWDPKATAMGEDKPLKVADHSTDAARYAVTTTERAWRTQVDRTALLLARNAKEAA